MSKSCAVICVSTYALIAFADARVSSELDTAAKSVSTDVMAVPLVKVRLSIVALVASNVATDDIPDAILIFDVIRSGNLSSLIVPVVY